MGELLFEVGGCSSSQICRRKREQQYLGKERFGREFALYSCRLFQKGVLPAVEGGEGRASGSSLHSIRNLVRVSDA
jgi:hypothetical protein